MIETFSFFYSEEIVIDSNVSNTFPLLWLFCSLIDRRGFIQPDTPQLAGPSNGITMYGATQSQSNMVGIIP